MSYTKNGKTYRLEPELVPGIGWRVSLVTGNKKKGTRVSRPITDPAYTLAQAECFVQNNCTADYCGEN